MEKKKVGALAMALALGVAVVGCARAATGLNNAEGGFAGIWVSSLFGGFQGGTADIRISNSGWTISVIGGPLHGFSNTGDFQRNGDTARLYASGENIGIATLTDPNALRLVLGQNSLTPGTFPLARAVNILSTLDLNTATPSAAVLAFLEINQTQFEQIRDAAGGGFQGWDGGVGVMVWAGRTQAQANAVRRVKAGILAGIFDVPEDEAVDWVDAEMIFSPFGSVMPHSPFDGTTPVYIPAGTLLIWD